MEELCRVCQSWGRSVSDQLRGFNAALRHGEPICQAHTFGRNNVVFQAARGLSRDRALLRELRQLERIWSESEPIRVSFLNSYPSDLRGRAGKQIAGCLAAAVAVGEHIVEEAHDVAVAKGADAAKLFQSALGFEDATRPAAPVNATEPQPLYTLWSSVAEQLKGTSREGFFTFRTLTSYLVREDSHALPFHALRDRPVVVRPLLFDGRAGSLARFEFHLIAEEASGLYLDLAPLGFRVLAPSFLESVAAAWHAERDRLLDQLGAVAVCLRVWVGQSGNRSIALEGGSAGIAIACALRALARGEVLCQDVAVTGEQNGDEALWPNHVMEKLAAARAAGLKCAVVGTLGEGERYPGRLTDWENTDLQPKAVQNLSKAYELLRPVPYVSLDDLVNDERRVEMVRSWFRSLSEPKALNNGIIRQLVAGYRLLHEAGHYRDAEKLTEEFDTRINEEQTTSTQKQNDILESLRCGLPRDPVHLRLYREVTVEDFLNRPGYPALLRAIRASEVDPRRGVREFEDLLQHKSFTGSAFSLYPYGMALRKIEELSRSLAILEDANRLLQSGTDPVIQDGPNARTDAIRLEVLRGTGAVCRKLAKTELDGVPKGAPPPSEYRRMYRRAEGYFTEGAELVSRMPHDRSELFADFLHSYGYFHMQFGFLEYKRGWNNREDFVRHLRKGYDQFLESTKCDPEWGAPDARVQLVSHKLLHLDRPLCSEAELERGYNRARTKTQREDAQNAPEAGLTMICCLSGLFLLGHSRSAEITEDKILARLIAVLCKQLRSLGARQCHAFDHEFLLDGVPGDPLPRVTDLFLQSAQWDDFEYANFIFAAAQEQLAQGRRAAREWADNALNLITEYLQGESDCPKAMRLQSEILKWQNQVETGTPETP